MLARVSSFLGIETLVMRPTILPYVAWVSQLTFTAQKIHETVFDLTKLTDANVPTGGELVDSSFSLLRSSKTTEREKSVRKLSYKNKFIPSSFVKSLYLTRIFHMLSDQKNISISEDNL